MYTDEQLAAWTRLKDHLNQTCILMREISLKSDKDIVEESEAIIKDIDDNIDIVEQMFII